MNVASKERFTCWTLKVRGQQDNSINIIMRS